MTTEINRPEPPTTPIPTLGTTDTPTGDNSNNGGIGESTTPEGANPTRVSISYDYVMCCITTSNLIHYIHVDGITDYNTDTQL